MPKKTSDYLKELYEIRKSLAIRVGLTGVILLLISLLAKEMMPIQPLTGFWHIFNIIIELIGKSGEAFILAGFIAFVLEQHPIALITRDVSKSIIHEIIDRYFQRKELIQFMLNCARNLNKFEDIDEEIYSIYERHGLLELADEPRRSNLSVIFKKEGDVEGKSDEIWVKKIYDYRTRNEAHIGNEWKLINKDGLVVFFDTPFPNIKEEHDEIINYFNTYFYIEFKFTTSFEINGLKYENSQLKPIFMRKEDFDYENCRPVNYNEGGTKKFNPELYGVYEVLCQNDGRKLLKLNLYLNVKIPPKEYIDLCFEVKAINKDFDMLTYEFISWTKGITFELQFGDEFETLIEEVLIGVPTPPIKSNTRLKYNGWIMPHSSVSGAWKRK